MHARSSEQRLAGAACEILAMGDLGEFRRGVLSVLHSLIEADIASYNEICREPPGAFLLAEPADALGDTTPERRRRFAELIMQNPLAAHFTQTGDSSAKRMSDFITRRQLRALELYELVYRDTETEDQIAFTVPAEGQLIGITMSRTRPTFTDAERELLERARRLIVPAYRNLLDRARLTLLLEALEGDGEADQRAPAAVLLVRPSGALEAPHPRAERLLRAGIRESSGLDELQRWGRRQREHRELADRGPLRVRLDDTDLQARYIHGRDGLDAIALHPCPLPGPERLGSLGLTPRQAAVLELVWEGARNREIATALSVSEHTVRHHLEEIYRRLGVSSRVAAANLAGRALADGARLT